MVVEIPSRSVIRGPRLYNQVFADTDSSVIRFFCKGLEGDINRVHNGGPVRTTGWNSNVCIACALRVHGDMIWFSWLRWLRPSFPFFVCVAWQISVGMEGVHVNEHVLICAMWQPVRAWSNKVTTLGGLHLFSRRVYSTLIGGSRNQYIQ